MKSRRNITPINRRKPSGLLECYTMKACRRLSRQGLWCSVIVACVTATAWGQAADAPAVLPAAEPAQQQDPEELFETLFGADMRRVSATPDAGDDVDLAGVLLQAASSTDDNPQMMRLLIDHVVELGMRHASGYDLATEALELGAERLSSDRVHFFEKLVELRQRQYTQARASDRTAAGMGLIAALIRLADAQYELQAFDDAMVQLRRATAVASAIRSNEARQTVKARMDRVIAGQAVVRQVQTARARLTRDKTDQTAARELLRLYVVELDTPEEARKYSFLVDDETWQKNIRLACVDITALSDAEAMALGDWYRELASGADSSRSRAMMLAHAVACYDQFLEQHVTTDLLTTKAALTRKQSFEELTALNKTLPEYDRHLPGDFGASMNLLKLVDIQKHVERGQWTLDETGLHVAAARRNQIIFPVAPHGSYQLQMEVMFATPEPDDVIVYLPVGSSAVGLFLSHPPRRREITETLQTRMGLATVRQMVVDDPDNPASTVAPPPTMGIWHKVQANVTLNKSQASIETQFDDKALVQWDGPIGDLSPMSRWQPRTRSDVLALHSASGGVSFRNVSFRMLDGDVTLTDQQNKPVVEVKTPEQEAAAARQQWQQRIQEMRDRIDKRWQHMSFSQKNQLVIQLQRSPTPYIRQLGIELATRLERE